MARPRLVRRIAVATATAIAALAIYGARQRHAQGGAKRIRKSIVVNRPTHVLYAFWRRFDNLARVMPRIDSVQPLDEMHTHWVATASGGVRIEWDVALTDDVPNEHIAWRSLDTAPMEHRASVHFVAIRQNNRTRVGVDLQSKRRASEHWIALDADLKTLKQIVETGEG